MQYVPIIGSIVFAGTRIPIPKYDDQRNHFFEPNKRMYVAKMEALLSQAAGA